MYPNCNTQLLDVAGGTGDITFRFLQLASKAPCIQLTRDVIEREPSDANLNSQVRSTFKATVMDINADMLQVGMKRASQELSPDLASRIDWQQGNAENLVSIPSASKDIYSIAFGIRNCTHIDAVLREAYRVLKPGGLFYCLEFSQVQQPLLSPLYDFWSFQVIPRLGQIISNDKASYQYFVESIRRFPNQEQFTNIIQAGGFKQVSYDNLFGGICSIHIGLKL